jgi:hypothetical protein
MNTSVLLEMLIDIERSVGVETTTTLRNKVIDAQECLLLLQKEMSANLRARSHHAHSPHLASSVWPA